MSDKKTYTRRRKPKIKFAVDNAFRTPPHKPYRLIPGISDRMLMGISVTVACSLVALTVYDMRQKGKQALREKHELEMQAMAARLNPPLSPPPTNG